MNRIEVFGADGSKSFVDGLESLLINFRISRNEAVSALQGTGWIRRYGRLTYHIRYVEDLKDKEKKMDGRLLVIGSDGSIGHFDDIDDICQAFPVQPYMVGRALKDDWDEPDAGWIYTDTSNGEVIDYFIDIEAGSEQQLELF